MDNTEIRFLSEKICSIMNVDFEEMISDKRKNILARQFCIHFATEMMDASSTDLARFFNIARRNVHRNRSVIRNGIIREKYYSVPYNKIKEGLSL